MKPAVNCVIATWGGDRRGGHKDIVYCKKAIEQLEKLNHNLTQVTLAVCDAQEQSPEFLSYINTLSSSLPIKIFHRKNKGLSYGAYSDVFAHYKTEFDYYIFMEDDYYFCRNNFDDELINLFESTSNCGYVCGFVSQANKKRWMGNSNGISSSSVLSEVFNYYGKLPHDESCSGVTYTEESGQVTFSDAFTNLGYTLADITKDFEVLHYYWQHLHVRPIPGQQNFGCKKWLFLPFEKDLSKNKSPFNVIFSPYQNKHKGEKAILFATGPTLTVYDFLEDTGDCLRVGVNGIALKPIALDYYFCGHLDNRSKLYLDKLPDYQVSEAKFGYISLDGIAGPQWLSLSRAKQLELKPYALTTDITFGQDISQSALVNHLIIFSALQFLVYSGVSQIYLVGSDATQLTSCDNLAIDKDRNIKRIREIFLSFAAFAKSSGVEIISINPIGLKGIFKDVSRQDISRFLPPPEEVKKPANYSNAQNQTIIDAINNGYTS